MFYFWSHKWKSDWMFKLWKLHLNTIYIEVFMQMTWDTLSVHLPITINYPEYQVPEQIKRDNFNNLMIHSYV